MSLRSHGGGGRNNQKRDRERRHSYKEYYETSLNDLIADFESNLDLSPILPHVKTKTSVFQKHQEKIPENRTSDEKETEPDTAQESAPFFPFEMSTESADIPRIQHLQHEQQQQQSDASHHHHHQTQLQEVMETQSAPNLIAAESHSEGNQIAQQQYAAHSESNMHAFDFEAPQKQPQQVPATPVFMGAQQQQQQQQQQAHYQQQMQLQSMHIVPSAHTHAHAMSHPFSQSYDVSAMRHPPPPQHQHHLYQQHQQQQHAHNNMHSAIHAAHSYSQLHPHAHMQQQQQQWNVPPAPTPAPIAAATTNNNRNNMSVFEPQRLSFPGNNTSSLRNSNTSSSYAAAAQPLTRSHTQLHSQHPPSHFSEPVGNNHGAATTAPPSATETVNIDDDAAGDDEEEEEDDENLFIPITPTLSSSALRALLSQLRLKCKTLHFKNAQQSKFIMHNRQQLNQSQSEISVLKLANYDQQQQLLMLHNQSDVDTLQYLRGHELHQTRQELSLLMDQNNELQSKLHTLQQSHTLQQLGHESAQKSTAQEHQRLLREIAQHKILFDQRGRELKQLRDSSENQHTELAKQLKAEKSKLEECSEKLSKTANLLESLRSNHEELKKQYDAAYAEKERLQQTVRETQLQMEEKDQNIFALQRVRENLEQEIEAISRTNRNFREIRDKSTSQLLDAQQSEIGSIKAQIAEQYENYVTAEKLKSEKLQQLLREKNAQIAELQNERLNEESTRDEEHEFRAALHALEVENHELRRRLEQLQFGDDGNMSGGKQQPQGVQTNVFEDPYDCNAGRGGQNAAPSSSSMDDFGRMMLHAAREEVEQLRATNEKLIQLHAKNHFRKPRVQDATTQTQRGNVVGGAMSGSEHTSESTSMNMSFLSTQSAQTHKLLDDDVHATIPAEHQFEMMPHSPEKNDKVLVHEMSAMTTDNSSMEHILS